MCLAQIPTIDVPDGKGGYEKNNKVVLQKLSIETKITGRISTNVVTMVFKNNSGRLRQGRLTFPLPEGGMQAAMLWTSTETSGCCSCGKRKGKGSL
ncbi:VIT domain-containing protein [Chryseobacterium wanjuense]